MLAFDLDLFFRNLIPTPPSTDPLSSLARLRPLPTTYAFADGEGDGNGNGDGSGGDGDDDGDGDEDEDDPDADPDTGTSPALTKARREAIKERKARQALEKQLADNEKAKLDENERLKLELEEARKERDAATIQARQTRTESRITSAASAAQFRDPADAVLHLDLDDLELDEHDVPTPESITRAVKALAKSKPYLVGEVGSGDTGGTGKPPTTKDKTTAEHKAMQDKYKAQFAQSGLIPL